MLGILFAYSALVTQSIWTSVFMHFLNNGFSVCVLYLNENYLHIPLDTPVNYTMPQLSSIIMTVLIGGAFIYLGSLCFKNKKDIIEA